MIVFSDASPTGNAVVDGLYRAAIMAGTVLSAARARRRVLLVAAALVCLGSDGWMLVPTATALVLAFVLALTDRRERVAGGLVGALVAWGALNLSWPASPSGATALLAAAALIPLWFSGYKVARRGTRRFLRIGLATGAVILLLGALSGMVLAITQRSALLEAADGTVAAAQIISRGDGGGDPQPFVENQQRFQAVADAASSWWSAPSLLVPVVAQNVRAVQAAAASGAELNTVAARLAPTIDYDALSRADGSVDVSLLASYREPTAAAAAAVGDAQDRLTTIRSPWLLSPVADQVDEFRARLDEADGATTVAAAAARDLPDLLGASGPRRYLLLLGNPAEARDLGGHIGNWAELTASDGKLDVVRVGEPYELFGPTSVDPPQISDGVEVPASLLEVQPTRFPQNWAASPDLSTVVALAADLYPQAAGGAPVDGVLYADPTAFAALLEVTGPVEADGRSISADTAVQFLTRDQYGVQPGEERPVTPLVRAALDRFTGSQLPAPARLAEVFSPAIGSGHLQFATKDPSRLLVETGLEQPLTAAPGGDLVAVINRNANPSKIDAYLQREIDYQVDWDPRSGEARSRVIVTLHNDAPAEGLPPVVIGAVGATPSGTNRTELSVLTPFDAIGVMVDGTTQPYSSRDDIDGLRRYAVTVDVPPGGERTVIVDLEGSVRAGDLYRLTWYNQPLANPDRSRVIVEPVGTSLLDGSSSGGISVGDRRVERITFAARK